MCTYHVPGDKIMVLFLSGQARALDTRKLDRVPAAGPYATDYDLYKFGPGD